jgi:hypothetical protein
MIIHNDLWYCTCVLLVTRPFNGYQESWPFDLDLGVYLLFTNFNLDHNFRMVMASAFILPIRNLWDKAFL